MKKIKKCPFCKSKAVLKISDKELSCKVTITVYDVKCTNDDCYLSEGAEWEIEDKKKAIKLWNKRKK